MVAKDNPDGYRILTSSSALTITTAIFANLTYDVSKDLKTIAAHTFRDRQPAGPSGSTSSSSSSATSTT